MTLSLRFARHLETLRLPAGRALVAVSGGADSLALLGLLRGVPSAGFELVIAHADHGIQPGSRAVAERVRAVAQSWDLPFHLGRLALGSDATETVARTARYGWLGRLADELGAELIFTGHHRDDQLETILMRLLHGSGPAGLAGIAPRRGRLVRPLLPFRRAELAEYVRQKGLEVWDDPANRDSRHERSWVRCELLPLLRTRVGGLDQRLALLGEQAARQRLAWDSVVGILPGLGLRNECDGLSVAASPLHGYDSSVLPALLGALGRRVGCVVGPRRAARIQRLLKGGRSGAVAELGGGFAAELTFGRLRLFRGAAHPPPWGEAQVGGTAGDAVLGPWRMAWRQEENGPLQRVSTTSWFEPGSYLVRPWRPGDRIRPLGAAGRRLVVRCMQEARVPRTQRSAWPVVEAGGAIVWVPGVCRAAEATALSGAPALRIDAQLG